MQTTHPFRWAVPAKTPAPSPLQEAKGLRRMNLNEAFFSPIPELFDQLKELIHEVNRYPDTQMHLRKKLAQRHGLDASQVIVSAGSSELLFQITYALGGPGRSVVIPHPSFPLYLAGITETGSMPIRVPLNPDGTNHLDALLDAIEPSTGLVMVCNPNNPTGGFLPLEQIRHFMDQVPSEIIVLLDEAYWELTSAQLDGQTSATTLLKDYPNLIILRTFSKAYGLAGLRVGYAFTHDAEVADYIRNVRTMNMIGRFALDAAVLAMDYESEYMTLANRVRKQRNYVRASLIDDGFEVFPSETNFLTFPFTQGADAFLEHKIVVRTGESILMPGYVRVSLSTDEDNEHFITVIKKYRQ